MYKSQYHTLSRNVSEAKRALVVGVIFLAALLIGASAIPASGAEPVMKSTVEDNGGRIDVSSVFCPDQRWLDIWYSTTTAAWQVEMNEYDANKSDLEVRAKTGPGCFWGGHCPTEWLTVIRVPFGAEGVDISNVPWVEGERPRFFKVNRFTGAEEELFTGIVSTASCTILPPPDGATWVWYENGFQLRVVDSEEVVYD